MTTPDPDAFPSDRLRDEVAFTLSPIGRQRREHREVAFALEIERLRAALQQIVGAWEVYNQTPRAIGYEVMRDMTDHARAALAGKEE